MKAIPQADVLKDLLKIMSEMNSDWEYPDGITGNTGFFADLGFESIDLVALGTAIEEYYRQSFPFAQFLAEVGRREATDIYVGELVDLIHRNLNGSNGQPGEGGNNG